MGTPEGTHFRRTDGQAVKEDRSGTQWVKLAFRSTSVSPSNQSVFPQFHQNQTQRGGNPEDFGTYALLAPADKKHRRHGIVLGVTQAHLSDPHSRRFG
ncbi:MAG: hypothetical protein OHK005_05900 [Candidatus Methylacidiphilales bacterium]